LPTIGRRIRRAAIAIGATVALGAGLFTALGPVPGSASSHREAPLLAADPQVDGTDLYAFVSPEAPDTTTIISNWLPFEAPAGGPNFFSFAPGVRYDVNIDNNGDARPDIIFRWVFTNHYVTTDTFLYNTGQVFNLTDPTLNFYQTYDLRQIDSTGSHLLKGDAIAVPSDVGDASMPDFASLFDQGTFSADCNKCKTWAGQADDPFFLDLRVFDLLYGLDFSEVGNDTLAGFNVQALAIKVPSATLTAGGDGSGIIGIWTTAERRAVRTQFSDGSQTFSGNFVQVSRLGMPLVNEVVVPLSLKDHFNASRPGDDAQFGPKVTTFGDDPNDLPALVNAVYGLQIPDCGGTPGTIDRSCDLVPVFLTGLPGLNQPPTVTASEMLRLNTTIPPCQPNVCATYSSLGVIGGDLAGFPNGRRLADDIIDVSLRVVEGVLIPGHDPGADNLGDGVDSNDRAFGAHFPYLGLPWSGSDAMPHGGMHRV
jgi:hypothetical protein